MTFIHSDIVSTNGDNPTPENSTPVPSWTDGDVRGSMVWFNQATMFQTSELGVSTIKVAKAMGLDTKSKAVLNALFPANVVASM